jgi:hypothetical protein
LDEVERKRVEKAEQLIRQRAELAAARERAELAELSATSSGTVEGENNLTLSAEASSSFEESALTNEGDGFQSQGSSRKRRRTAVSGSLIYLCTCFTYLKYISVSQCTTCDGCAYIKLAYVLWWFLFYQVDYAALDEELRKSAAQGATDF